jgi:hypothetical protein
VRRLHFCGLCYCAVQKHMAGRGSKPEARKMQKSTGSVCGADCAGMFAPPTRLRSARTMGDRVRSCRIKNHCTVVPRGTCLCCMLVQYCVVSSPMSCARGGEVAVAVVCAGGYGERHPGVSVW